MFQSALEASLSDSHVDDNSRLVAATVLYILVTIPHFSKDLPGDQITSLAGAVRSLQSAVDVNSNVVIEIRCKFLIKDAMKEARKLKFTPSKLLKVRQGGPRHEVFFTYWQQKPASYIILKGRPE